MADTITRMNPAPVKLKFEKVRCRFIYHRDRGVQQSLRRCTSRVS